MKKRTLTTLQYIAWIMGFIAIGLLTWGIIRTLLA